MNVILNVSRNCVNCGMLFCMKLEDFPERFRNKVEVNAVTGCWIWKGSQSNGYGQIAVWNPETKRKKNHSTHRWAWEQVNGPFPTGLEPDHICRRRECVNPAHVEPVTHRENIRRSYGNKCRRGHEMTKENSYISPVDGNRRCKTCIEQRASKKRPLSDIGNGTEVIGFNLDKTA